jgi:outer membrane protein OmpA-like peptidoglycan-associated protein
MFIGGFISNYFHQFYDPMKFQNMERPRLNSVDPELGVRYAYFPHAYFGLEGEGTVILAGLQDSSGSAQIYGLGIQGIVQLPGRVTPFVDFGVGLEHTSSDTLGSDTDFPIHIGAGARLFVTPALAVRADVRLLRGPSEQSPYTLNASYGDFGVGISWVPGRTEATRLPPPDPDPDRDGILGENDKCPNEPGPGTPDGCPVKDRDGDGIMDNVDKCPDQAETKNGYQDDDGCPDTVPDTDSDGIDDLHDKCPDQAEDKDGFQDEDGCPDPDNDNDGVMDAKDKCVNVAGPVENFGCPDVDTDKDGIVDRLDNCPNEAGTEANHGCKAKQLVVITKDHLQILDQVRFQTGTAKLSKASNALLDNIARVLLTHLEIWKIRVEGHTDNVGKSEANQKLSEDRATAVVNYLVGKGVAPERLQAVGHGDTVPIGDNSNAKGREANRRVEFNILNE